MTESMTAKRCFVIGPIGDRHADPGSETREIWEQAVEILEEVIQPACSAFGLRPLRADEISQPGEIPEQIFIHLRDDEVVIADLTGANANVMYELGLRHSTNHLTIQIGERGRLPFDIGAIRTILFKRTAAGLVEARKALSAALSSGLDVGGLPVAATRVWRGDSLVVSPHSTREATPSNDAGYLEKIADMAEGIPGIVEYTNKFAMIMKEINNLITTSTEQMTRLNQQKGPAAAKVEIANRLAERLAEPAGQMESNLANYRRSVEQTDPGVRYLLGVLKQSAQGDEATGFRQAVGIASTSVADTIPKAAALRDQILEAGDATRLLRKVNARLAAGMSDYIAIAQRVATWKDLE